MTTNSSRLSETKAMKAIREQVEKDGKADELPQIDVEIDETRLAAAQAVWRERRKGNG